MGLLTTETKVVKDRMSPERPGVHFQLHSQALDLAPEVARTKLVK